LIQQPGTPVPIEPPDLTCLVVEPSGNVPVTEHGGVAVIDGGLPIVDSGATVDGAMGDTNGVVTGGAGLVPGSPISVEPIGMPARPTCDIDGAGVDGAALAAPAQPLDVAPAIPPPSNSVVVAVCDVGPPVEQTPVEGSAGLMPGVAISVAPSGMPTGPTGAPDPMASGDVAPSGEVPIEPTCASAALQTTREAARVEIANCIFMVKPPLMLELAALTSGFVLQQVQATVRR
jgi:hypothetical protein